MARYLYISLSVFGCNGYFIVLIPKQKWDLKSYTLAGQVTAHNGTVLGLFLSGDQQSLFSSAGDAAVNVGDRLHSSCERLAQRVLGLGGSHTASSLSHPFQL